MHGRTSGETVHLDGNARERFYDSRGYGVPDGAALELALEDLVVQPADHVVDPLGAERVLGVDEDGRSIQPAVLAGELDVHGHLVGHLRLAGAELAVHFGDRLRLHPATQEVVDLVDLPRELADLLASFEHLRAGLEAADVGRLAGALDDVVRRRVADVGRVAQFGGARDRDALIAVEACVDELVCGRGADAGEFLEIVFCHRTSFLLGSPHKPSLTPKWK